MYEVKFIRCGHAQNWEYAQYSPQVHIWAHVHGDFCAKFVEYARKIQRNATFSLHRPFTVTTDGAQVIQEKSHVVRNGKTR